jgi:hypothetical protein
MSARFVQWTGTMELAIQLTIGTKIYDKNKRGGIADDLIIAKKGESVRAMENYVNVELNKITAWAKNNDSI